MYEIDEGVRIGRFCFTEKDIPKDLPEQDFQMVAGNSRQCASNLGLDYEVLKKFRIRGNLFWQHPRRMTPGETSVNKEYSD